MTVVQIVSQSHVPNSWIVSRLFRYQTHYKEEELVITKEKKKTEKETSGSKTA